MKLQKETKGSLGKSQNLHGKWYGDACGTAFALELVGERWSLLIVRELMLGGLRFSDLRRVLPGISAKVLTERLESLEAAGVLQKRQLAPPVSSRIYELTEWGYYAEPAIQELGRWAARSPLHNPQLPLSPVSFMLSLRTMIDHAAARSMELDVGFTVSGESFLARLRGGEMPVERAEPNMGEIGFAAQEPLPLLRVFYGKQPFDMAEATGEVTITGDHTLAQRFVALFDLPRKIERATA